MERVLFFCFQLTLWITPNGRHRPDARRQACAFVPPGLICARHTRRTAAGPEALLCPSGPPKASAAAAQPLPGGSGPPEPFGPAPRRTGRAGPPLGRTNSPAPGRARRSRTSAPAGGARVWRRAEASPRSAAAAAAGCSPRSAAGRGRARGTGSCGAAAPRGGGRAAPQPAAAGAGRSCRARGRPRRTRRRGGARPRPRYRAGGGGR